ncbi:dTDP-Rha--alpha-D-GlcNAc-pyrophosphate polyprenol alpha-3-L-rhamnosyltransferase [Chromatium okenii]|uniref:glycosyltransferase family 2 protein n=1 Tax=Chromatium okenii TaxID=61644 RepID=UPI001908C990|nr:glycosyltransferase family 2 protein [Chromatium okenii]MBK1642165.1 dTDP-Rha--alpha-D-GlcNAc-pyrophosphate polyprenol alpha-3-L-rhamnosyltransferase [Chromatium okenii]
MFPHSKPHQLSILIVNYNGGELLTACVASALNTELPLEILLGDNGSTDDSLHFLRRSYGDNPHLTIIENGSNLGFAAAHNRLIQHATAPLLLLLNPDCLIAPGTLEQLLSFANATPDAGMIGGIVRDPDGREQVASRRVIPDPWIGLVQVLRLERWLPETTRPFRLNLTAQPLPTQPQRVAAISGAAMLVRRTALDTIGLLDEGYFLHCEDLDWFVRCSRANWGIYLVPTATFIHHKGHCSKARPLRVEWHKHRGMARFFRKFQQDEHSLPFNLLVLFGIWSHFILSVSRSSLHQLWQRIRQR